MLWMPIDCTVRYASTKKKDDEMIAFYDNYWNLIFHLSTISNLQFRFFFLFWFLFPFYSASLLLFQPALDSTFLAPVVIRFETLQSSFEWIVFIVLILLHAQRRLIKTASFLPLEGNLSFFFTIGLNCLLSFDFPSYLFLSFFSFLFVWFSHHHKCS